MPVLVAHVTLFFDGHIDSDVHDGRKRKDKCRAREVSGRSRNTVGGGGGGENHSHKVGVEK